MKFLTNNIIQYGLKNTIIAYKTYKNNKDLFNDFVHKNLPAADLQNGSIKLILLSIYTHMDNLDRMHDWEPFEEICQMENYDTFKSIGQISDWKKFIEYIDEDGLGNKVTSITIRTWRVIYQSEKNHTHFIPQSMPHFFHNKPLILNRIFYWIFHKSWFDNNLIINAWDSTENYFELIKQFIFSRSRYGLLMPRFRRWIIIDGTITVIVESLLYINVFSIIIYVLFVFTPRLANKGAVGSPILILIFHICIFINILYNFIIS